jgi:preprotein translocase subunit SecG
MTGRGSANFLTRATSLLAVAFFATSMGLTLLAQHGGERKSVIDRVGTGAPVSTTPANPDAAPTTATPGAGDPATAPAAPGAPAAPADGGGVLDKLRSGNMRLDR